MREHTLALQLRATAGSYTSFIEGVVEGCPYCCALAVQQKQTFGAPAILSCLSVSL